MSRLRHTFYQPRAKTMASLDESSQNTHYIVSLDSEIYLDKDKSILYISLRNHMTGPPDNDLKISK